MEVDTLLFIIGSMGFIGYVFGRMNRWNGD